MNCSVVVDHICNDHTHCDPGLCDVALALSKGKSKNEALGTG